MRRIKVLLGLPILGMLAMPVIADDDFRDHRGYNRLEQRLDRQHWRIKQGVRTGELTTKEAKRLRKQHRHIAKLERAFQRDGRLNRYERKTLRRELNAASDRIYRLKHNDRYRHQRHHESDRQPRYYDDGGWAMVFSLWDQL